MQRTGPPGSAAARRNGRQRGLGPGFIVHAAAVEGAGGHVAAEKAANAVGYLVPYLLVAVKILFGLVGQRAGDADRLGQREKGHRQSGGESSSTSPRVGIGRDSGGRVAGQRPHGKYCGGLLADNVGYCGRPTSGKHRDDHIGPGWTVSFHRDPGCQSEEPYAYRIRVAIPEMIKNTADRLMKMGQTRCSMPRKCLTVTTKIRIAAPAVKPTITEWEIKFTRAPKRTSPLC